MKTISLVNIKGGVGKTISSVNLAACLALKNKKTLLIDIDPQSNSTQYLDRYDPNGLSSYDVLMDKDLNLKEVIKSTGVIGLDIIPANIKMIMLENEIIADTKRSRENRLSRALKKIEDEYDFCIIDCPPSLGVITTNALVASKYVLVPIKIDQFALDGFNYLMQTINQIIDEFNPDLKFTGAFITMDKRTSVNRDIKQQLKEELKDKVFNSSIRENVKVTQSTFLLKPVVIYDKKCIASKDYEAFTNEVLYNIR
ncbi:MAG: AAA family ATPase [Clostridium tyrobutyricum]|jgi:chromosome partitioning protein|uniref:ParA family protein n=1 Tax=Clostridium tyrobutyricum TaxID=1519 RepID=UPI00242ED230|nr:ParA family protein [Clostridium tyrobutyricum]MCH4200165.1 AAA family ATPase [Clostridium tyrobutyricum]MCH4259733.1 AAA family ATPase [Clostridium tyrobutyricum]